VKLARQEIEDHWRKKFAEHGIPYPTPKHGPQPMAPLEVQAAPGAASATEAATTPRA